MKLFVCTYSNGQVHIFKGTDRMNCMMNGPEELARALDCGYEVTETETTLDDLILKPPWMF